MADLLDHSHQRSRLTTEPMSSEKRQPVMMGGQDQSATQNAHRAIEHALDRACLWKSQATDIAADRPVDWHRTKVLTYG